MKYLFYALLSLSSLHAEPFRGIITAQSSMQGRTEKLEYLTDGKKLLIRPAGDGFKRASGLVDLARNHYTHLQHQNHSYTEVGDLAAWPKLMETLGHPVPQPQPSATITTMQESKEILGRSCTLTKVSLEGQEMEIWGQAQSEANLPAFYQWYASRPEPHPTLRLEEQIGEICRSRKIFPILIVRKIGESRENLFEVTAISPASLDDKEHPAIDENTYLIPADHRLTRHPLQQHPNGQLPPAGG